MAFNTEAEAYAAFGLEPPQESDPEIEVIDEGTEPEGEEQQDQEQQDQEETPAEEPGDQVEDHEGQGDGEDPLEKLRRELTEQHQKELEEAKAQAAREQDSRIAAMGLKNPYDDNKPITTWEEYQQFQEQNRQQQWDRIAKQTGMSREQLDKLVAEHPDVVKGLEAQAQAQAAQEAAQQQQLRAKLDADIRTISAMCPEVRDAESLVAHHSYEQVAAKMRAIPGLSVADAFILVNHAQLAAGNADKTAQRIRNNLAGKNHLQRTEQRGSGGVHISSEQMRWYKRLMPGATEEQIRKHHESMNK